MGYQLIRDKYYKKHQNQKLKYWLKVGVYGIYCNLHLVYVGKSKNLFHRFCSHLMNTFLPFEKLYNSKKYVLLRNAAMAGAKISFRVIEYTSLDNLSLRLNYWISYHHPPLNTIVGGHKKKVQSIEGLYKAG